MFKTSFAAAALVALAAARGDDTGVGYDNAKTITFDTGDADDWGLTMHMYNSQATDGTNEIHGDVDLSITDGSYRVVYGFCIAPATDPTFWDCLAIRADISPEGYESSINQRSYVFQDMYLPADYDFSAGILSANADTSWSTSEASENWKVTPQRQEKSCAPGSVPDTTTCTKARGHFYRHFDTTAVDQDLQLSLSQAGDDYQVVGFYQEYAAGEDWSDNLIGEKGFVQTYTFTPEVAEGETATPEQRPYLVTPVMEEFNAAIRAAVDAYDNIKAQDGVAHQAKEDAVANNELIVEANGKITAAVEASKTAATAADIKTELDKADAAIAEIGGLFNLINESQETIEEAVQTAEAEESEAQFDAVAREGAAEELGHMREDQEELTAILDELEGWEDATAAQRQEILDLHAAKVTAEAEAAEAAEEADDTDADADGAGNVDNSGDDDQTQEGGASAVTTFAAATLAAVYAIAF